MMSCVQPAYRSAMPFVRVPRDYRRGLGAFVSTQTAGQALNVAGSGIQISSLLSSNLPTTQKNGGTIESIGAGIAPFNPIVGGAVALVGGITSLFKGANPQEGTDTSKLDAGGVAINQIWNELTGDDLPTSCVPDAKGRCSSGASPFSQAAKMPANGVGNTSVDVNQAISQAESIIAQVKSLMVLPQSLSNSFFTTPYLIPQMQQIAAARGTAGVGTSSIGSAVTSLTSSPVLLLGLGGLILLMFFM